MAGHARRLALAAAVLLALLVAWVGREATQRTGAPPDDGPLLFRGGGGIILPPGPRGQMTAVLGSMLPCTEGGVPVTVTGFEVHSDVDSTSTEVAIRTIPGWSQRDRPGATRWMPVTAAYRDFRDPRFQHQHSGTYDTDVRGAVIDYPCKRRRDREDPVVEWMTLVQASPAGARIDGETVTYEYDGDEYVTRIDWTFIICGTAVRDDDCPDVDPVPGLADDVRQQP